MYLLRLVCVNVWVTIVLATAARRMRPRYDSCKKYIRYDPGTLNVIIVSSHGGQLRPPSIPDRERGCFINGECVYRHGCGTPDPSHCRVSTDIDDHTAEIATIIANTLRRLTGCRPHVVYNNLYRIKLDANRDVDQAAFGVQEAIDAYNNFTAFINEAKASFCGFGLLLDIHGQTHSANWTELGYAIRKSTLNGGDFSPSDSSIRKLGEDICGADKACFKNLVSGTHPNSLGYYLSAEGHRVVPSPVFPTPGTERYYSGGYITRTHGSRDGGDVDAIQVEMPATERFPPRSRKRLARSIARAVTNFLLDYY